MKGLQPTIIKIIQRLWNATPPSELSMKLIVQFTRAEGPGDTSRKRLHALFVLYMYAPSFFQQRAKPFDRLWLVNLHVQHANPAVLVPSWDLLRVCQRRPTNCKQYPQENLHSSLMTIMTTTWARRSSWRPTEIKPWRMLHNLIAKKNRCLSSTGQTTGHPSHAHQCGLCGN